MSTLSSASTLAQVQAAYDDNASYAEDASVSKCKTFITACRLLLRRMPARSVHGGRGSGEEVETTVGLIQTEMREAQSWLAGNDTTGTGAGGVRHYDFSGYRD